MGRIRVMQVIARMNVGGPAVEIAALMRNLDGTSFEQRLVTGFCAADEADFLELQAPDVTAVRVPGFGRAVRPGEDLWVTRRLVQEIRDYRPDVIHTHTAKAGVLGRVAARLSGIDAAIVHTHHGHLLNGYFSPARTRAIVGVERFLSRRTDRIVTVGTQVMEDLLRSGIGRRSQYEVIRSGVQIGPLPDKGQARRELGVPEGVTVVTMLGRITQIKRPDRFLDVVAMTRSSGRSAHFLMAGGGDQEESIRQRVAQEGLPVSMLGWRSDIETVLAATDIMLLTSDNEGTPISLVQAGLAGVPAVATNVGAVHEVVAHGQTGLLAEPDAAAVADALGAIMDDNDRGIRLGRKARDLCESRYGLRQFIKAHEECYQTLTAEETGVSA